MPELPDITIYCEALDVRIRGQMLERVRIINPFLLRTAVPPIDDAEHKRVLAVQRLGKRIILALEDDLFLILHLMVAGRLRWLAKAAKPPGRIALATFEFANGTLAFTEAGTKRRASLHCVRGGAAAAAFDMGGLDPFDTDVATFAARLRSENHTLKRALTDPRLMSGVTRRTNATTARAARTAVRFWPTGRCPGFCTRPGPGRLTHWNDAEPGPSARPQKGEK